MSAGRAEFGMYAFASVTWAWDELWRAVHDRAPWTPPTLEYSGDVHASWDDDDCMFNHVCGWPFAAFHRADMHLIGAFSLDLPQAETPAHYRSVLFGTKELTPADLDRGDLHAVANSADSLSGWHSLGATTVGAGRAWPGPVTFTGAHRDSLAALAAGAADIACIDSWSLAFIEHEEPELLRNLHRIGVGPRIPTPAITARRSLDDDAVDEFRSAFSDAVADPSIRPALAALHVTGFVHLSMDDYLSVLSLGPPV